MNIPKLDEIDKELCERSLYEFVKLAWDVVEPAEFQGNWHIETICEHLEAVTCGDIKNLAINIPPRHTKSMIVSVMWPAWEWTRNPGTKWLFVSYDSGISERDAGKSRQVMSSRWYQRLWGDKYRFLDDENKKRRYRNSAGGQRVSTTVGGAATGEGGDRLVIDDPHNVRNIYSETERRSVIDWWSTVMTSRQNNPQTSRRVLIMQRVHEGDLVGHIKSTAASSWEWLVMPAMFESKTRCKTSIFVDPRKDEGELLWPDRFTPEVMAEIRKGTGPNAFSAQYQQHPSALEGNIFKREWWRFYDRKPSEMAPDMDYLFQSWDMAFKETKDSDFVVGQVWGVKGANRYLFDEIRDRMDFVRTKAAVRSLTEKWPEAKRKLVEDKANGPAIISELRNSIIGLIAVEPEGSKESRAYAVTAEIESGNVFLPSPKDCPWVDEFIEEMSSFPKGLHDDRVDTATQALRDAASRSKSSKLSVVISLTKLPAHVAGNMDA